MTLDDVHVRVGNTFVLRGVSHQFAPAAASAIIGRSGTGKTTLLRAIAGLCPLVSGSITLGTFRLGVDESTPVLDSLVSMLPQDHGLVPELSLIQNCALPLRVSGVGRDEARTRVLEVAEAVGLARLITRSVGELSGGQRQRFAALRAMVGDRPILLADEPTGSLDPATASSVMHDLVAHSAMLRKTLIVVTHDHGLARQIGNVLELADGVLMPTVA